MPQSALPDVNTKFIIYTREAINSWKSRNYDSAIGSLYAFNGILPDIEPGKYRVIIDTKEYENKTKQDLVVICNNCYTNCRHCQGDKTKDEVIICSAEYSYGTIKVQEVLQPLIKQIISGTEYERIWVCPTCKTENVLSETKMIQKILKDPSFLAIVPKPPNRRDGIIDRTHFHTKFTVWFWTTLTELEAQAARFRQDYKGKDENEQEFTEIEYSKELSDE